MKTKAFGFELLTKATMTLLLCLVATIGFANSEHDPNDVYNDYKYEKKRTIDANFYAKNNYKLNLYGKYSDYKIATWNENQVSFHVEIKVKSNKENVVKEMINNIDVEFNNSKNDETITARTIINNKSFKNVSFDINYYIMIPEGLYLTLDNSYGNIEVDKLNKALDLELDYGNFSIDSLLAYGKIDVDYGNVKIKYADKTDSAIDYGNIRVNSGNEVDVRLRYGNMNVDNVKSLTANCRYSDVSCSGIDYANFDMQYSDSYLKNIKEVRIDSEYSDVEIYNLLKKINFTSDYGDIEINNVDKDFELIDINANYADVDITLAERSCFTYDISVTYGDIDAYYLKEKSTRYIEEDDTITVKGNLNDEKNAHYIKVVLQYGDLDFEF